jgi:RNA polymerase sigma factor (sigma-70 family)
VEEEKMAEDASSRKSGNKTHRTGRYGPLASDDDLVTACLRGDKQAWDALIERYQGFIFSIALRRGLSRPDAEDVFQNVCIKLYEHLTDLRDVRKLAGWLAAVVVRECGLMYRKSPSRVVIETELSGDDAEPTEIAHTSPDQGPEGELLALERREVVRRMLNELSDECRKLLTMLYVAEQPKSYNEVAEQLKLPLGSIGPKRARCLAKLRSLLEEIGY